MFGYHGTFLKVDLSSGAISELPLERDDLEKYIGGSTLAAKLMYEHIDLIGDPLAPEAPLVFASGPLTGSALPMVSRSAVCGISPATGIWGEATTGGTFPVRLKASGFDGIFSTGRARKPVYLYIKDGRAEIRDAANLWGKDSYETQDSLKNTLKEKGLSISCIGKAGEHQVRYACIMNDGGRAAGRCGLGALMGSKHLKAIAVSGRLKAAAPECNGIGELTRAARADIAGHMMTSP